MAASVWLFRTLIPDQQRGGDILNIGKLRKGGELYYLNSVARGVEDYYTNSGEAPGYWMASGGRELELEGQVDPVQLRAVLAGRSPVTGRSLLATKRPQRERVPGFDLTFRAPKSVSLLHALGDKEASNEVVSAHNAAVAAALGYLERHAAAARRGRGGLTRIATGGFVAAAFRHRTSRAGDPLLHTHVLVANIVKGADAKWSAPDGRLLYKHAKTAGYLYQAHLRAELTRRLDVGWSEIRSGCAELTGIPTEAIRAFSQRRRDIEANVADTRDARAAQVAALRTRQAKNYDVRPEGLLSGWKERAYKTGLDEDALAAVVGAGSAREPGKISATRLAQELAGPQGLTAATSTFTRRDVIQAICVRHQHGAAVAEIEAAADDFLESCHAVALAARDLGAQEAHFSTHEMLELEARVIEIALGRACEGAGVARTPALRKALKARPTLFPEQQEMVRRLASSGHGVEVVIGKAGTGKTFALDAARDAWQASGLRVVGCALSARAAEELELGSGIASSTITTLLNDLEDPRRGRLDRSCVLVVDEAGMVGTRVLERVLTHAEADGAKVVLVGDDGQLPEIQAGGAFRALKERLPALELLEVRRQPQGWERAALDLLREGRSQEAIDAYRAHDRVVVSRSAEDTRRRLISDWWATLSAGEPAVMVAARRSDVSDLNHRARAVMRSAGALAPTEIELAGERFAVGDRVMTLRNSRRLGVKNGTRGELVRLDAAAGATVRLDDGGFVELPSGYLDAGHLTHAYAITGHKAQGMTTARAFVLGDQTLYREWAYVAMSRGRHENRLYVVSGIDPERDELGGQVAAPEDPMKELVTALGRSRAKELALDSLLVRELRKVHVRERTLELE